MGMFSPLYYQGFGRIIFKLQLTSKSRLISNSIKSLGSSGFPSDFNAVSLKKKRHPHRLEKDQRLFNGTTTVERNICLMENRQVHLVSNSNRLIVKLSKSGLLSPTSIGQNNISRDRQKRLTSRSAPSAVARKSFRINAHLS